MLKIETKKKDKKFIQPLRNDVSRFINRSTSIDIGELKFEALKKIEDNYNIPNKNQVTRIITLKHITVFDFVLGINKNEIIKELYLTSYSIGKKNISIINELLNTNKIEKLTIVINSNIKRFNKDCWNNLKLLNANIKLVDNHSKIILMKTNDNFYCVEGSGNLNHNARIEQYVFSNNKQIYDFHSNWINEL